MGRKRAIVDSSDSSEGEVAPLKVSGKRTSKPSTKIKERDKENLEKANKRIATLKKRVKKLQAQKDIEGKHLPAPQKPLETPLCRITFSQLNQSMGRSRRTSTPVSATGSMSQDNADSYRPEDLFNNVGHNCDDQCSDVDHNMSPPHKKRPQSLSNDSQLPSQKASLFPAVRLTAPPALGDYADPVVRGLLLTAMHEYEAMICAKSAFPSIGTQAQWAATCWRNAQDVRNQKVGEENTTSYEFTDRMLRLVSLLPNHDNNAGLLIEVKVKRRGSRIRGGLLNPARAEVKGIFGFRQDKAQFISKNAALAKKLHDHKSFHYKDTDLEEGFCQNPVILSVLVATLFKDEDSLGVTFHALFNPVSIDTLALIFTVIDFCISEWTTGKLLKNTFSEKDFGSAYTAFRADLVNWHNLNPEVTTNRRQKLFKRAVRCSGAIIAGPKPRLVGEAEERARKELEGHTGETDSELEGD
ncbi:hypothetical protein C0992_006738, partial [Termitomyces sp. T32_za158]